MVNKKVNGVLYPSDEFKYTPAFHPIPLQCINRVTQRINEENEWIIQ